VIATLMILFSCNKGEQSGTPRGSKLSQVLLNAAELWQVTTIAGGVRLKHF
jgi:hypothetical protein